MATMCNSLFPPPPFGSLKLVLPWQMSKYSWKHPSIKMGSSEGFSLDSILDRGRRPLGQEDAEEVGCALDWRE